MTLLALSLDIPNAVHSFARRRCSLQVSLRQLQILKSASRLHFAESFRLPLSFRISRHLGNFLLAEVFEIGRDSCPLARRIKSAGSDQNSACRQPDSTASSRLQLHLSKTQDYHRQVMGFESEHSKRHCHFQFLGHVQLMSGLRPNWRSNLCGATPSFSELLCGSA